MGTSSPATADMKTIILACLAAVALAAPQQQREQPPVAILRDDRVDDGAGNFQYSFAADNGIEMEVAGSPGAEGAVVMRGFYLLPREDGSLGRVEFVADENGFHPQSDLLPVGPPPPPHVQELLRIADEQRAQGIQFDDQGRRL